MKKLFSLSKCFLNILILLICLIIVFPRRFLILKSHNKHGEVPMFVGHLNSNPNDIIIDSTECYRKFAHCDEARYDFKNILNKYFDGRDSGFNQRKIASDIFGVQFHRMDHGTGQHSYPLLTADTLRSYCDVFISWFDNGTIRILPSNWGPQDLKKGAAIFVSNDQLILFATEIYPKITQPFILVSGGGDTPVPNGEEDAKMLQENLLQHWFTMNPSVTHHKIQPVPRGFANKRFDHGNWEVLEGALRKIHQGHYKSIKKSLMYVNLKTSGSREHRRDYIRSFMHAGFKRSYRCSPEEYLENLATHKFVFSPPGNGVDCHRHWESILMGSRPIVWNNTGLWPLFNQSKMLVLPEKDWESNVTIENFNKIDMPELDRKYLLAQYWFDQIDVFRYCIRNM